MDNKSHTSKTVTCGHCGKLITVSDWTYINLVVNPNPTGTRVTDLFIVLCDDCLKIWNNK